MALSKGQSVAHVCRALSITEQTYRDELLDRELFDTLWEVKVVVERLIGFVRTVRLKL